MAIGSGFVEVDAEVLKEQQEKERLAEERRKSEEEAKRLEATVDFVASNATRELREYPDANANNSTIVNPTNVNNNNFLMTASTQQPINIQMDHQKQTNANGTPTIVQMTPDQIIEQSKMPTMPTISSVSVQSSVPEQRLDLINYFMAN